MAPPSAYIMTSTPSTRLRAPESLVDLFTGKRFAFRQEEFPADNWWYGAQAHSDAYAPPPADDWRPPGTYCSAGEPLATFRARMAALTEWLAERDEAVIGLTCHWGVLAALTGSSFENNEVRRIPLSELRVRTDVEY